MTQRRPSGAHRAGGPDRRRTVLLGISGLAVLVVLCALLLGRPGTDDGRGSTASTRDSGSPPGSAAASSPPSGPVSEVLARLQRWTATELDEDTPLAVPDQMRAGLLTAGVPTGRLVSAIDSPPRALLVIAGTDIPPAAVVLAHFGSGGAGLSVVDPEPGVPTADELRRREQLAAAVLANPGTGATGPAADVLRSADIDARLLGLLSVLVSQLGVGVADFPLPTAQPDDGPPARQVLLDRLGGAVLGPGTPAAERLGTFLAAQLPPFAPAGFEVTEAGALITFRYSSTPDADVTENTP